MLTRDSMDESIPSFEEYLKLLQSTPDILGKIRDMKVMDGLLRIFFSNFTITATGKDFRQGSEVIFELKEPWKGFLKNGDFVRGAGTGTQTRGLFLGKEALYQLSYTREYSMVASVGIEPTTRGSSGHCSTN